MLEFKPIELSDKPWMDELMRAYDLRSADFSFANIFIWDSVYKQSVARFEDRLMIKLQAEDVPYYAYPVGKSPLKPAVEAMLEDARAHGIKLHISGVVKEKIDELEAAFPGKFRFEPFEVAWDYLYNAEKMCTLSGKKLHGKRNHINRFVENNPDWSFEPITAATLQECLDMDAEWMSANTDALGNDYAGERAALEITIRNYEALGLEGGILRAGGRMIAFAIGEMLNSDTFVIHFEKAYSEIQGAYPMIFREFSRYICQQHPETRYINREDDMGLESLRKSKRSYYPEMMVEKYSAHYIGD